MGMKGIRQAGRPRRNKQKMQAVIQERDMTAVRLSETTMRRGQLRSSRLRMAVLAFAAGAAGVVGATGVYTNSAGGNWSADASWTGGKPAAGGAADAVIVFDGAAALDSTNNLSGAFLLNQMRFVSDAVTLSGNALVFTNNEAAAPQMMQSGNGSAAVLNSLALGGDTVFSSGGTLSIFGAVSGKGGLIKTGEGSLVCEADSAGALSYAGTTRVSAGRLVIETSTSRCTMNSTDLTVCDGATLRLLYSAGVNLLGLPNSAVVNVASNATITSDVPTISCGFLKAASGAVINGSNGCLSLHAADSADSDVATLGSLTLKRIILEPSVAGSPTQTVRFDGTGTGLSIGTDSGTAFSLRSGSAGGLITYVMDIADSPEADADLLVPFLNFRPGTGGFALVKRGEGLMRVNGQDWSLASSSTKTNPVSCSVEAGTLVWASSTTNAAGVNFSSVSVAEGATLQLGAGGTAGAAFVDVADDGTLAFNRSDNYTFPSEIYGSGRVEQQGSGTLTLTGGSSYSGGTTVSAGTLLVNVPGSLTGGGDVAVTGGTLGGNGTLGGPVMLAEGGLLLPGGDSVIGTLTLSNTGSAALTLGGGNLRFDLSTVAGTCDQISVAGSLVLDATNRLSLAFSEGTPPAGTYTLMTYASKSGTGVLTLDKPYPNATLTVGDTAATLTVRGPGITYLTWAGSVSGTWDTTTENWALEGAASTYAEGDSVLFDDSASGNYTVSSATAVTPSSVTFDNSVSDYVLSADVAGANAVLVKMGSRRTTLSGSNTYGGGTILSGGYLNVGSSVNLPAGPLTFSGGVLEITGTSLASLDAYTVNWESFDGGLNLASGNTMTIADAVKGSGRLSKAGAGTLVLSGANTYSGGTTVSGGYLRIRTSDALGAGSVTMTGADSELDLMGGLVVTNAITVRGDGMSNYAGSLQSYYGTSNTWNGPVTLGDSNARIGAPDATLVIGGVVDSGTNTYDFIMRNPNSNDGTVVLAAANAWLGNLWVRCGTVRLGTRNAVPVSSALYLGLNAGQTGVMDAALDLAGFDQEVAGIGDRGADNAHVVTNSASEFATLTVNTSSSYTYAGTLSGNLNVAKTGTGTLTLTGTNTTFGSFSVNAGTLTIGGEGTLAVNSTNVFVNAGTLALANASGLTENTVLRIVNGGAAKVNVPAGVVASVGYLYFADKQQRGGTYGASGSGAGVIDDEHFSGSGALFVRHGNGGTLVLLK